MDATTIAPCVSEALQARQLALEEESLTSGIIAYRERNTKLETNDLATVTDHGKKLLASAIDPMEAAIIKFVAEAYDGPGKRHTAVKYLEVIEPDVASLIACRVIYDSITRLCPVQDAAIEIGNRFEDECHFRKFQTDNKLLFNGVMRHLEKHPIGYQRRVRRSMLLHAAKKFNISWGKWSKTDKLHVGMVLVDLHIQSIGDVERVELRSNAKGNMYYLRATEALQKRIADYKLAWEVFSPKWLPMICPPQPWTSPTTGGYYDHRLGVKLVKSRSRGYQQELPHRDMPIVYEAVNALQDTPWKINAGMYTLVKEIWEAGLEVKGLPSRFDRPLLAKPADIDTNKDAKARWKKEAGDTFRFNLQSGSKRIQAAKIIHIADRFVTEPAIYFPVQLDFRGRMYAMPQYLNPQGCDLAKSLLTFAEGKPLGEQGYFWLCVHIANTFGYDKCSLKERAEWTTANSARIQACANDPIENRWWMEADKPFQFLAACIEWLGFLNDGEEEYVCSLPIMVDGSCNGLQHFSAMLRDEVCGANVNLIPQNTPADIYQVVADEVKSTLAASTDPLAAHWLSYGITRKLCKRPVMVLPYGGTREAVRKYVLEYVTKQMDEEHKPHPFGEELRSAADFITTHIWDTMKQVVSGPRIAMDWLQKVAKVYSKEGLSINWTTPTGFWVQQAYASTEARRVKTALGDEVIRVTLREDLRDKLDSRKQTQAVAPNFVHSMDASALMLTVSRCLARGLTSFAAIHDSYGTVAADMPLLLSILRLCFVEMYTEHDVLTEFREGAVLVIPPKKSIPDVPPKGKLDLAGVLASEFFFA